MRELIGAFCIVLFLCFLGAYVLWAIRDANRRRKSPVLVTMAVVFFFPFGLIAWLLFRPRKARSRPIVPLT